MRSPAPHHSLGGLLPQPPPGFALRKQDILAQLARPDAEYTDASPKGSVDAGIRDLLDDINGLDGFVTTSSCAGRASVFVEGCKQQQPAAAAAASPDASCDDDDNDLDGSRSAAAPQPEGEEEEEEKEEKEEDDDGNVTMGGTAPATVAGVGGKGGGGTWLYVSHDPFPEVYKAATAPGESEKLLGLVSDSDGPAVTPGEGSPATPSRLIHFKFEPMILHVLTASPEHAQLLLKCGLQAGFRESGAINLTPAPARGGGGEETATPLVAIRSMGLGLESLVGARTGAAVESTVSSAYLRTLMGISNERFAENTKRIQRFRAALAEAAAPARKRDGTEWEDAEARRQRKKAEGLRRKAELQSQPRDTELDEALDLSLNADMS